MSDSTSGGRALDTLTDAERDARIEQLLVSGLDEYFAGRLDHAINVWTRVLFLDRSNDRARAYIDRARRAQGERQREAESLVHRGLQAFDEGDVDTARSLLTAAVEQGAAQEQTLPVLRRIGLLDAGAQQSGPAVASRRPRWMRPNAPVVDGRAPGRAWWWLVAAAAIAAVALSAWVVSSPTPDRRVAYEPPATPLPVPTASESPLRRARSLHESGRLADALAQLDRIDRAHDEYAAAEALRATIQDALLRATPGAGTGGRP